MAVHRIRSVPFSSSSSTLGQKQGFLWHCSSLHCPFFITSQDDGIHLFSACNRLLMVRVLPIPLSSSPAHADSFVFPRVAYSVLLYRRFLFILPLPSLSLFIDQGLANIIDAEVCFGCLGSIMCQAAQELLVDDCLLERLNLRH
jgi:hypothetical protein